MMITPIRPWKEFVDENEKTEKLKQWGLSPLKKNILKQLYYSGFYVSSPIACEVLGFVDDNELVISVNGNPHAIATEHFLQMQVGMGDFKAEKKMVSTTFSAPRSFRGKSLSTLVGTYVVVDIETTGIYPATDEITEIGAIFVKDFEVVDTFQSLVYTKRTITQNITVLTGITSEMIASAPQPSTVLPAFLNFVKNHPIVAHNASFDISFLYDAIEALGKDVHLSNDFIDTISLARTTYPALKNHKLGTIAQHLNISYSGAHRALQDCYITNACYVHMSAHKDAPTPLAATPFVEHTTVQPPKAVPAPNAKNSRSFYNYPNPKDIVCTNQSIDTKNPFYEKNCVITGDLKKFTRGEAMQLLVNNGAICGSGVTKKCNYLILGGFDLIPNIKGDKTSKQLKAEKYIEDGIDIKIISELEFYRLMGET